MTGCPAWGTGKPCRTASHGKSCSGMCSRLGKQTVGPRQNPPLQPLVLVRKYHHNPHPHSSPNRHRCLFRNGHGSTSPEPSPGGPQHPNNYDPVTSSRTARPSPCTPTQTKPANTHPHPPTHVTYYTFTQSPRKTQTCSPPEHNQVPQPEQHSESEPFHDKAHPLTNSSPGTPRPAPVAPRRPSAYKPYMWL